MTQESLSYWMGLLIHFIIIAFYLGLEGRKISALNKMIVISHFRVISTGRLSFFMLCQKYVVWIVGGEWECPIDRQRERLRREVPHL